MQFTPKMGHFYFSICSNLSSRLGRSILPASNPFHISQLFQLIGVYMLNEPCSACTIMFCFSGSLSSHRSCLPSLPYFPITFPISVSLSSHVGRSIVPASHSCHISQLFQLIGATFRQFALPCPSISHVIISKCKKSYFQAVCPPMWDGASCLPPTLAGHTALLPCMTFYDGVFYSPQCKIMLGQLSRCTL